MSLTKARELAVLSVLIAHPAHGYQIAAAFEQGPLQFLGLKRAAVYAILARFLERGWIAEVDEPGESYPDRRVNHVTEAGRAAVTGLMGQVSDMSQTPLMALLLLHDSGVDITDEARAHLALRRRMLANLSDPDDAHRKTASHHLAVATLKAEIDVLQQILMR